MPDPAIPQQHGRVARTPDSSWQRCQFGRRDDKSCIRAVSVSRSPATTADF